MNSDRLSSRGRFESSTAKRLVTRALVPRLLARSDEVKSVSVTAAAEASWYEAFRVEVVHSKDRRSRAFLKDLGAYRALKTDMALRRNRERQVYLHLSDSLRASGVEMPAYFGSVWDEDQGRTWLLTEDVHGKLLKHLEFEHWILGATALGQIHRRFEAEDRPRALHLIDYDSAYFKGIAQAALTAVSRLVPSLTKNIATAIQTVLKTLGQFDDGPNTLLHGAYLAINILVDAQRSPPRVCPLDWELAGWGPPLYDFAFLADGFDAERLACLWAAYQGEEPQVARPMNAPWWLHYEALRAFKTITTISVADERNYRPDVVKKLVGRVESISEELTHLGTHGATAR